jgi:quercetin dioxygenase-like cupin family protein
MILTARKILMFTLITTTISAFSASFAADSPTALLLTPEQIQFHPAPGFPKGAQIVLMRGDLSQPVPYTIRFKLPDGYVIPPHWHSTDEEVTVLSGTLNVGMAETVDKSKATALSAGGYQVVPAKAHHFVYATGETVFQLDGMGPRTTTFVNPAEWTAMILKSSQ